MSLGASRRWVPADASPELVQPSDASSACRTVRTIVAKHHRDNGPENLNIVLK